MTFEQASKSLLFSVCRQVTEQAMEHPALRFVYHRQLMHILNELLELNRENDLKYALTFSTMFGSTESPGTSLRMFAGAADTLIANPGAELRVICQDRDYTELPEVVNIVVE